MQHKANRQDIMLVGKIETYMKLYGVDDTRMANALGVCRTTWFRRKKNPTEFTLRELGIVCRRLQIPREEMRGLVL